jgi:hypothetical protein
MCLMLYIGTATELPLTTSADLRVEEVGERRQRVTQWFSQPIVRFVGAHTGCSCGFPSVIAQSVIEYYEGMPFESDDRTADLRSIRALIHLIGYAAKRSERVELYPVADGDESRPPKGTIDWQLDALDPDRLFFNEQFMHVIHNRRGATR